MGGGSSRLRKKVVWRLKGRGRERSGRPRLCRRSYGVGAKGSGATFVRRREARYSLGEKPAGSRYRTALGSAAEFALVLQRGDAHVATELGGEGALVVETEVDGDVGDLGARFAEGVAGGLDAGLDEVVLGRDAEAVLELAVELSLGESDAACHLLHEPAVAGIMAEGVGGLGNGGVGGRDVALKVVALDRTHQADDLSAFVEEGQFLGDEPVGDALLIEEEFDDAEERLASRNDFLVIGAEADRERTGKEIEVGFAHDLSFIGKSEAPIEVRVAIHELVIPVLGEEGHAGDVVEHARKLGGIGEVGEEAFAQIGSRVGVGKAAHGSIVWRMKGCT